MGPGGLVSGRHRGAFFAFAVALAARLGIVAWARGRFPAADDGHYYDLLARRLASGAGYTWLWPDGAVTYVAHYPVGYPLLLAAPYALFGASPGVAMAINAVIGASSALAVYSLLDGPTVPRWRPLAGAMVVALHPALLPYTAAVMTEGVTASLLVAAAALAARARTARVAWPWLTAAGSVMACAILVRPQSLLLAPVFGFLAMAGGGGLAPRLLRAAGVTALALACISPWTLRNCVRMHRCALVSVNGGWNLLIGAMTTTGGWQALTVPPACATVWDEAAKDRCFGEEATREIARAPRAWLGRAPAKIAMTLDYFAAAPSYLHSSNPSSFDRPAEVALVGFETLTCRLLLLAALVACGRLPGPRALGRKVIALGGSVAAVTPYGWIGYLALPVCVGVAGGRAVARGPMLVPCAAAVILATVVTHAVFFGAGRYGLVVAPFVAALAFAEPSPRAPDAVLESTPSTPLG